MKTACVTTSIVALFICGMVHAAAREWVWIEAEQPTTVPVLTTPLKLDSVAAWGVTQIISAGKLLSVQASASEARAAFPENGAVFGYAFDIAAGGTHEVWARIGFDRVRSDFDWRIDTGSWRRVAADTPLQNLQQLQAFNELGWLKLGTQALTPGAHLLEIRHPVPAPRMPAAEPQQGRRGRQGTAPPRPAERVLLAADCFCISKGAFQPYGKFKPGEKPQTAEDQQAAQQVFAFPTAPAPGPRVTVALSGLWQIAEWDDPKVTEATRLQGAAALPKRMNALRWFGIGVPGDRDKMRNDFGLAHRCIYRTQVFVPAESAGRGWYLHFKDFGMIATVFVNGKKCGWSKAFHTQWLCDVSRAITPGATNEIAVVIKDCVYAIKSPGESLQASWRMSPAMLAEGRTFNCDVPISGGGEVSGLAGAVRLSAVGQAYTADVFVKPSLKKKQLGLEISMHNPTDKALTVTVENEVIPWNGGAGGAIEMKFTPRTNTLGPRATTVLDLADAWAQPRLWWPDDPQLYWVITKVLLDGTVIDETRTRFGFREWEWDSAMFKLNGVKWPLWADCSYGPSPQAFADARKQTGMRMTRYWRDNGWGPGEDREASLDKLDELGVPVRCSGVFDGQVMNFGCFEVINGQKVAKKNLFDNWIAQMDGWIRTERNHPCIFIWSLENEIVYIAINNTGSNAACEPEIRRGAEHVLQLDPTRPVMVDGGNALTDMSLPVNGAHYCETLGSDVRDFPDAAYTTAPWYQTKCRDQWPMAPNKPVFHGECFFANGWTPAKFATIGGEGAFIGVPETRPARALFARMATEGWRWAGDVAAWHFWVSDGDIGYYNSFQPVAAFCRQWNWTFAGGTTMTRTLKVCNDTRFNDPITLAWQVTVGGSNVGGQTQVCEIPAGAASGEITITCPLPPVTARETGAFVMTCARGGKEVFRETKPLALINPDAAPLPALGAQRLVVLDPHGTVTQRLKQRGIAFTEIAAVAGIPDNVQLLVLGKDAVPESACSDPLWQRLAANGAKILVLEQAHSLRYQAVPADFEPTEFAGRIAFAQDLTHPAFAGLEQRDFFTWSQDHIVYRGAYRKPTRGARSLVQCDNELGCTALAESEVKDGLLVYCQLVVGEKLARDPVAQRLFDNLLNYIAAYAPLRKECAVVVDPATPRGKLLAAIGLKYSEVGDPLTAITGAYGIAVIEATPPRLRVLAEHLEQVQAFTSRGGWIMLLGLTPEGLADYNKIVGFAHVIRPFRMERVLLPSPADGLTAGLTLRDVVMEDSERVVHYMGQRWFADDAFTYVVDYTDIAPFAALPTPEEFGKPAGVDYRRSDNWPENMVNGFTHEEFWRYSFTIHASADGKTKWTMRLPHEEELIEFGIAINQNFCPVTKINLYCDADPAPIPLVLKAVNGRQNFALPGRKARNVTIEIAAWEPATNERTGQPATTQNIGIDNLWLIVKRPKWFLQQVRPLLTIGGLMKYTKGTGGIVLNQLNIVENERLPVNAEKKSTITKTMLKNLGAIFAGAPAVIVGAGVAYAPVAIPDALCNAFITRKGNPPWFAGQGDLSQLPLGEQKFAGVTYRTLNFETSPIPACMMLRGNGSRTKEAQITGIPVNKVCDALFFLHTCNATRQAQQWRALDRRDRAVAPPVVFCYVVHYADGVTVEVPVVWNIGVGHWIAAAPQALQAAQIAWSAPLAQDPAQHAVLYAMQWNNPRPNIAIRSVDLVYGPDKERWGTPALLAITAATAGK